MKKQFYFIFLMGIIIFFNLQSSSTFATTPHLDKQIMSLDKKLLKATNRKDRLRLLNQMRAWTDQKVLKSGDSFDEDELVALMQYASLLKALDLTQIEKSGCSGATQRVIESDTNPLSKDPSPAAKKIIEWVKLVCL